MQATRVSQGHVQVWKSLHDGTDVQRAEAREEERNEHAGAQRTRRLNGDIA